MVSRGYPLRSFSLVANVYTLKRNCSIYCNYSKFPTSYLKYNFPPQMRFKFITFVSSFLCCMFRIPAGYCFVEFADLATAEKCLHKINGKPLPGATPVSEWDQLVENQNLEGTYSAECVFLMITDKFNS